MKTPLPLADKSSKPNPVEVAARRDPGWGKPPGHLPVLLPAPGATASCSWRAPRTAAHQSTPAWCSAAPVSSPCPLARNRPSHPRRPTRWKAAGRRNTAIAWSLVSSLLFPLTPSHSSTMGAASPPAPPLLSCRLHSSPPSLSPPEGSWMKDFSLLCVLLA